MSNLKAGFSRVDITPHIGAKMGGYFFPRYASGVLDPLYATAVAFDDGEKRAVVISVDQLGVEHSFMEPLRKRIADSIQTDAEGVFVACTHTHLSPVLENDYAEFFARQLCDAAVLAVKDLSDTQMYYTHGRVEDVAFVRRYRMKDGSIKTNPGLQNPDVEGMLGSADEQSSLLILKREGKPEIGIVNFQVHPDVIGGSKISADYPKFVRDTYEANIPNSRCMYINGAQGDTNHVDIRLSKDDCFSGYKRARYMGTKIAMSVLANYLLAKKLHGHQIRFDQQSLFVEHNKGTAEEIASAIDIIQDYQSRNVTSWKAHSVVAKEYAMPFAMARRIALLADAPDKKELKLTAIAVGDVVFAGFPGEPFTDLGRTVKEKSNFTLTIPACCACGYEGYYPTLDAYAGGYETCSARYIAGTGECLADSLTSLVNSLY